MEFRMMVMITLYARQQKRHRCIEQSFGLCGRGRGWDDLGEWHWNMYNIIYETSCQSRFDPWVGKIPPGEGNGIPLQYFCLENPTDARAWWATVHGVAKSQTRLSDFTCSFHFHALEKELATHSSVLVWRIPWTEETGGLQSMVSQRVRHDWTIDT